MASPVVWVELFDLSTVDPQSWRTWYDEAVLTRRAAQSGVRLVRRGSGLADPLVPGVSSEGMEIAVYEVADTIVTRDWLADDSASGEGSIDQVHRAGSRRAYRQLSSTLEPYEPPPAEILHGGFFEVPPGHHAEFNAWYEQEHIAEQLRVPGYLSVRRFQGEPESNQFLALYDVGGLQAIDSPEAAAALISPWGDRVRTTLVTSRARRLFHVDRIEFGAQGG
jgi:hypothetical protein